MADIDIKFISKGFREILTGSGVKARLEAEAKAIQQKANAGLTGPTEGFSAHVWPGSYGGGRWVANVSTTDGTTMRSEAESKLLERAVGK